MKRIISVFLICFIALSQTIIAQTREELEEYFNEGQYFFNREEYRDALIFYLRLANADSLNANYNFKVGECYLNIEGSEHLAIPYFEKAVKKIVPKNNYRKKDFTERAAPLHAYFYLGNAYRMNNQLNAALESYMKFIDSPYFYGNYNQNVVDREIQSCERAAIIRDTPVTHEKISLGPAINTLLDEERPVVSGDGTTLIFIRKLKFYDAVFCSRLQGGTWQEPVNINPQILSDGDYYPTGLSDDGKELLLARKQGDNYDIYSSVFDGETWTEAKRLPGKINSAFSETHASFGPDDQSLLISSDRKGGKGGYDIWIAEKDKNGEWGKLKNMGKQINTGLNEQIAYWCKDHNILFFSSEGHYTMGGYDIFYARQNGKKWKIPVNLGYPINNTRGNLFYSPGQENCREGYYSIRTGEESGNADIYLIRITSERVLSFASE
ncbi:MAG: PD40 domain-containing protein [Bacteroidales bacterium]|nr:PD40 domain-containing protein [Bacteroidales bacterium]